MNRKRAIEEFLRPVANALGHGAVRWVTVEVTGETGFRLTRDPGDFVEVSTCDLSGSMKRYGGFRGEGIPHFDVHFYQPAASLGLW